MLNPERVDRVKNGIFTTVEMEFTTEDGDSGVTIVIDENDAMNLAHMIMDQCSYKAKIDRGECLPPGKLLKRRR